MLKGDNAAERQDSFAEKTEEATLTARGADENVRVVRASSAGLEVMPWRSSVDLPRACVFTVHAGIGYLL